MRPQPRADHLHIRASQRDKRTLALAARLKKKTISQFVLETTVPVAEQILAEDTNTTTSVFHLDAEDWEEFVALLDTPPRDLPELKALLASKPVWET